MLRLFFNYYFKYIYIYKEFIVKCVWIKSQGQFVLSLIWQADSLLTPHTQVKAYNEQTGVKGGKKDKEREVETG